MDKDKIIDIKNLYYSYDNKTLVIKKLSMEIYEHEWVCILGHNGSGKSTLSKLIIGLLAPLKGDIEVYNKMLSEETVYDIRRDVSIVFQNPDNQFVGTTVIDDMAFGMENQQIEREEMKRRIEFYLSKVNMVDFKYHEPHLLSGGQKQRVAIAGALALDSKVLIFDESTSMLDPQGREDIVTLIKQLKSDGNKTIISITHDLSEAMLADRIIIMRDGNVEATGTPNELLKQEELLLKCGLDIPMTVKLSKKLIDANIISELYVDQEELVNSICQYNLKK